MKIHALQSNIYQKYEKYSVGLCEQENIDTRVNTELSKGHRASSDVTFTSSKPPKPPEELKKLGKTFWDKIAQKDVIGKSWEYFDAKTSVMQAGVALVVAGILRPATNMAMADKDDRDDAKYAASHAIASAVIGFIVSSIVLKPFDDALKKIRKDPKKYLSDSYNKFAEPLLNEFGSDSDVVLRQLKSDKSLFEKLGKVKLTTMEEIKKLDERIDAEKIEELGKKLSKEIQNLYKEKFPKCNEKQIEALTEFDKYIDKYSTNILNKNSKQLKDFLENHTKIFKRAKKIFNVQKIGARQLEKSGAYKIINKVSKMMFDTLILGVPKAMLTIALIPPILKYVFGMEKKKPQPKYQIVIDEPIFQAFKGGAN